MRVQNRPQLAVALGLLVAAILSVGCSSNGSDSGAGHGSEADQKLTAALQAHAEGRLDEAIDLYQEVLTLDPENKFAFYNLGVIEQTRSRLDGAAAYYMEALNVDPVFEPALFNLAIVRSQQGSQDEAISLYQQVIQANPSDAGAHLNLGFLLLQNGQGRQGRAELRQAVQLDPSLESRIPDRDAVVNGTTGP
jgi:tetratricopeptide (TPR) repeat protein